MNFYKWGPIALAICSYLVYHTSQKYLSQSINPFLVTCIAYTIAAVTSGLLFFSIRLSGYSLPSGMNWPLLSIGLAVVGLDVGFLLAYRAGWGIGTAPVLTNVVVAMVLLPVGVLLFKEKATLINLVGLLFCITGLILLKWR